MINISLSGQVKVLKDLSKIYRIQSIVNLWMKAEADEIMRESFEKNFKSEGRPKWTALTESTKASRRSLGFAEGPILDRTGDLRNAVTSMKGLISGNARESIAKWGVNQLSGDNKLKYSVHQAGKGRRGQSLPARKMIGFQPEDATKIKGSLSKWIFSQLK